MNFYHQDQIQLHMFSAVKCLPIQLWRASIALNTTNTVYQTIVNVTCYQGNDSQSLLSPSSSVHRCNELGSWTPEIGQCIGIGYKCEMHAKNT